jgi:hypothetical protein
MTFWDVRPLVKDRLNAPHEQSRLDGRIDAGDRLLANDLVSGHTTVFGYSASTFANYRAGGVIQDGLGAPIDVQAATLRSPGYAAVTGKPWYLYAVFPGGLPRWVRYVDSPTTPRIPLGPLGVLTLSSTGPTSPDGAAIATSIAPPSSTGLATAGPAALLAAGPVDSTPVERGFVLREGRLLFSIGAISDLSGSAQITPTTSGATDKFTLTAGTHFPLSAKSVFVAVSPGSAGTPLLTLEVWKPDNSFAGTAIEFGIATGLAYSPAYVVLEIPTLPDGLGNGMPSPNIQFSAIWSASGRTGQNAFVLGWRL